MSRISDKKPKRLAYMNWPYEESLSSIFNVVNRLRSELNNELNKTKSSLRNQEQKPGTNFLKHNIARIEQDMKTCHDMLLILSRYREGYDGGD